MLLDLLSITPYIAIAASLFLMGIGTVVYMQFGEAPKPVGFNISRARRTRSYRGFVKARRPTLKEAA
jgi:hypothetical protein